MSVGIDEGCHRIVEIEAVTSSLMVQQRLGFREVAGKEDERNGSSFTISL